MHFVTRLTVLLRCPCSTDTPFSNRKPSWTKWLTVGMVDARSTFFSFFSRQQFAKRQTLLPVRHFPPSSFVCEPLVLVAHLSLPRSKPSFVECKPELANRCAASHFGCVSLLVSLSSQQKRTASVICSSVNSSVGHLSCEVAPDASSPRKMGVPVKVLVPRVLTVDGRVACRVDPDVRLYW